MNLESIIFELAVIFVGAAVMGTLFLYGKQPIIIAYLAIGFALGPNGFAVINETAHIEQISHFGVILLLFLLGLHLQPAKLLNVFRKTCWLTLVSAGIFAAVSGVFAWFMGLGLPGALVFGAAMMFSSTVVSLKLIPTTTLHHRRTGELMTSVLLIQDILAILVIIFVTGEKSDHMLVTFVLLAAKFALVCGAAFLGVRYVMIPLLRKFDVIQEYTFVATLAWCLLWAEVAHLLGLSYEMGAFVAGLSIASCQVALIIAEDLKPLREFFLVLFFFAVGAALDFRLAPGLLVAAAVFGACLVPFKAWIFRLAFGRTSEAPELQRELAVRLSQASEFSILLAFSASLSGVLSEEAAMMIQMATIVTFILSTYWVVLRYPTPISRAPAMRRD
jgi:Kef-type K+ transport system membrane component KefB